MPHRDKTVLISGAGIAGPVLGWWLNRYGFTPTIVEKAPVLREGGHAVDLWGSAVEIVEQMGVLPQIEAARTRNDKGVMIATGRKPVAVDLSGLQSELGGRHVEIMRGDLVSVLYNAGKEDIEYIFGDQIAVIEEHEERVRVTFDSGRTRQFAMVVGADGQHSNVRRLAFGNEERFSHHLGGYICGYTIRNILGVQGAIHRYVAPDKTVAIFPIRQRDELGVIFIFRRREPLDLDHEDIEGQKRVLRDLFKDDGWEVPRLLDCLGDARYFYFDSLSQIQMDSWTKGRIALVGDAGFGPGPAVGGGTGLAVVSAYMLADALAEASGDPAKGFKIYQASLSDIVAASRQIGPATMKAIMPSSELSIALSFYLVPILMALPASIRRWFPTLPRKTTMGLRAIADAPVRP